MQAICAAISCQVAPTSPHFTALSGPPRCDRRTRLAVRTGDRFSKPASGEGLDAGLGAAEDEGVDVVGALVGVDGLQVEDVADHVVLV